MKLAVIILNYRRTALTIDCLRALEAEVAPHADRCAVVIDNGSDDGSARELRQAFEHNRWSRWIHFIASPVNRGFAGGNNLGFETVRAENYLLLNSDARVQPGSLKGLLESLERHSRAGAIGPRLQSLDGEAQVSCFRYRTPMSEFLEAAGTGVLDRWLRRWIVAMGVFDTPIEPPWVSFACIVIRRAVVDQIGPMDDGYFMYFEDIDYSRRMHRAGWSIVHDPSVQVVHLRGGTSSVKAAMKVKARVPRYYYQARSRYFAKFYGGVAGLWFTNFMWLLGRGIALTREAIGSKARGACRLEALDNWTNWFCPLRPPAPQKGGEL